MTQNAVWLPDLLYSRGSFNKQGLICDEAGRVVAVSRSDPERAIRLKNRALLPGLINTHSHAFQRVIRGCTEHRTNNVADSFWTWREKMYTAANRLDPEDIYDASRMAFLEMALSGITTVGEFHYLHHGPNGKPYDDPNLLGCEVVRAARDVGVRIALLRVAYARSGYRARANPEQNRFIETEADVYLQRASQLHSFLSAQSDYAWMAVAPHSVRAVPVEYLKQVIDFAREKSLMVHMHISEQPAEVQACLEEYGKSPVILLQSHNLLSERFTAIHAIHVTAEEAALLAEEKAKVCACPTTERNLGDGVFPADAFFAAGVTIALGTDSQIQIDLLEDARELEYNLRLRKLERAILAPENGNAQSLAELLFNCVTVAGAQSLGANAGELEPNTFADFFTVNLDDPAIAGAREDDLLTAIIFSLNRAAIREVVVGGKMIVEEGRHRDQDEIVRRFGALQKKLWG